MESSKAAAADSPSTSAECPRELTMDERADQLAQQACDNLNRLRRQKEAAQNPPRK
jgi:hypothetical protein